MDYQGKIYQMVCDDGFFYIGSTKTQLRKRFYHHKHLSSRKPEWKVYKHINQIGWDKVNIQLIEEYPCKSKQDLFIREYEHIKQHCNNDKCLNTMLGTFDKLEYVKQYSIDNKERLKQKSKEYYAKNREQILEKKQEYINNHKEEILAKNRHNHKKKIALLTPEEKQLKTKQKQEYDRIYRQKKYGANTRKR